MSIESHATPHHLDPQLLVRQSLDMHTEIKPDANAKPDAKIKPNILAGYQVVLYSKALHPETLDMHGRRIFTGRTYELEAWIMKGSHALRLECGTLCTTELICEHDRPIPTSGIVFAHIVGAEKDIDYKFVKQGVRYISSIQLETLAPNLYYETYEELLSTARRNNLLNHLWTQPEGQGLSVLEIEREATQVTALGFHMMPATGIVVRTQTMFEVTKLAGDK